MIREIIQNVTKEAITGVQRKHSWADLAVGDVIIEKPDNSEFGDYAVNIAFSLAKQLRMPPGEVAGVLADELEKNLPPEIDEIEVAGGYINFFLSPAYLQKQLLDIAGKKDFGAGDDLVGKKVMVEFTDPNAFKVFHIGHLMSNTIGESIARLFEFAGAEVVRACYPSDIGLNTAKAIWGVIHDRANYPKTDDPLSEKVAFLGRAYVAGTQAYEEDESAKEEIKKINEKLFAKSDPELNDIYKEGRQWSLDHFEEIYKKLGTKFDLYIYESEMSSKGEAIVREFLKKGVFEESEGAIVFKGDKFGLHTRVFISSQGLPTYEAKELGLNKEKFEKIPDLAKSIIVTANEQNDYFKVVLKAMESVYPDIAAKTEHISHGMMRFTQGKMSSRKGNVINAEAMINQTKEELKKKETDGSQLSEEGREAIAVGAIKYSILKQSPGHDIIFDFEKSLSVEGDSGPYLQYTYARLNNIVTKAGEQSGEPELKDLTEKSELNILKELLEFPEVAAESGRNVAPQYVVQYLHKLATLANRFYENVHVLKDEDQGRRSARLMLVSATASVLGRGMGLLGMKTLTKI